MTALEALLEANAAKPKRERLTFQRIFEELRLAGYAGGYAAVRRYVNRLPADASIGAGK